jgi:hypothetical protein
VHYDKCGSENHWTAFTDPTVDAAAGRYRFHVTGHNAVAAGVVNPYVLDSASFDLSPYTFATVVPTGAGTYAVGNPTPAALANFRYRPMTNAAASVDGAGATFTVAPGETRVIQPGGITDAYGNTNSQTITVTDAGIQAVPARPAETPVAPQLVCATAAAPSVNVPEAPWTPGFALLAMAMAGLVVRRARGTLPTT